MTQVINSTPLDIQLNQAVLKIAAHFVPTFKVSDDAPSTYSALKKRLDLGLEMTVYGGGSGTTIFGTPEVNHSFRAWHDWCHWKAEANFSLQGETEVCNTMLQHIQVFYGLTSKTCYWRSILIAEIIGQSRYYEKHNDYVSDQRAFCVAYMKNTTDALNRIW